MNKARRIGIMWVIVFLVLGSGSHSSVAQGVDILWPAPVNLSHSGAAEAPAVVTGLKGQLQVFWWDRFDGIMTTYTATGARWSPSQVAPIHMSELQQGAGGVATLITTTISMMPQIVGGDEVALALWLDEPAAETGLRSLLYSQLRIGTAVWSAPALLTESAVDWEIAQDSQGVWHLIYRQPQQLATSAAGIYYQRSLDSGASWSDSVAVYTSLYTRLWTVETAHLSVAADGAGNVLVGWDDPNQGRTFYARSTNAGVSWREPMEVKAGDIVGQQAHFVVLPASSGLGARSEILLLWKQRDVATTCLLMQQHSVDGGKTWSVASPALEDRNACPAQIATAQTPGGQVFLVLGEGTERLLVTVWNGGQWSKLVPLSFSFENPETGMMTYLAALQANITSNNALVVAGQGQDGEIWMLQGQVDVAEWAFAPPSPWSSYEMVSENMMLAGLPAVATDSEGRVHIVWSAALTIDQPETALYYSRWDKGSWSRPTVVFGIGEGVVRSPALVFVNDVLHAVWSSGPTGTVFYSQAYPHDAHIASSWRAPYMLGAMAVGSSPAFAVDLLDRLHVVYAVPLNAGRGIYYTRTDDKGDSWLDSVQIFDAAAAHWTRVEHPSVTVDELGTLHAVWVRMPLPNYGPPQGVYYAQSTDHGKTWSEAVVLTDGDFDWPQVLATLTGQIVVTWQDLTHDAKQYRVSDDYGQTWGYASPIPGLQGVEGRMTLARDSACGVHLTVIDTVIETGVKMLHLSFSAGQWFFLDAVNLEGVFLPEDGVVASVVGELGLIDAVGIGHQRGDSGPMANLWHTRRSIACGPLPAPGFAPEPTATKVPGPTPNPTPTPRPTVNPNKSQSSMPVIALGPIALPILALVGLGVAFLLVGSVVVWKIMKR